MAKQTKKTFHVYARLLIESSIEIRANSLEEAINDSKGLKVGDYIEFNGEHCDSKIRVTGVYENYEPVTI